MPRRSAPPRPRAWGLLVWLSVGLAGVGHAHSSSRANTVFTVDESGRVELLLELSENDVLDVFDVDLSSEEEEPRLLPALEQLLPRLVKLRSDQGRCPLRPTGWDRRGIRTVRLRGEAMCPEGARELTVQWGFASVSSLDLVTYATVRAPADLVHHAVLAKKGNTRSFIIRRPALGAVLGELAPPGGLAALAGLLAALSAVLLADRRRRLVPLAAAALGLVGAALAVVLAPRAPPAASPSGLAAVVGLGLALSTVLPTSRPGRARTLRTGLALLAGAAAGAALLQLPDELGAVHASTARLARLLGGLGALGVVGGVGFVLLRALDARTRELHLTAGAALGGAAALLGILLLFLG